MSVSDVGTGFQARRVLLPSLGVESWTVIGPDLRPVVEVDEYLAWLTHIERSQRGALSAPFPSPPAGPAPWFWRQGGGLRFAARHPLLLARAGKVAQIGSAAVTIAEAELGRREVWYGKPG